MEDRRIDLKRVVGGGYGEFWRCEARYRVMKGGKAAKKSATTALNFIYRIMKHKGSNLLVVRAVHNTHRDSTFAQLKWAQEKLGVAHLWQNNVALPEMVYKPTGQKILFRGFDDVYKLASTTVAQGWLCWVWLEEAFEIRSEEDFDKLDLTVPRGELPDGLFKQTTITFNPWSQEHWLKKRFFDRAQENVQCFTVNYLNNEFLDETDIAVFERMKREHPRKYQVAGLGEWGIDEGLVYENWSVSDFDVDALRRSGNVKAFFGLDYGYVNDPTAFIAFFADPEHKRIYIFDEFYLYGMLNCQIAEQIKMRGYAKERIRADSAEPKSNDDLKRLGISRILPSVKGPDSVINGIISIQEYAICVHPSCRNTLRELASYCYARDRSGKTLNVPQDTDNHLMDALRYAFYDVRFFKPARPQTKREGYFNNGISAADFFGDWK